ncbi:MAG TPA: pentapeptide repeat-containing protein [Rhodanobacter sp.]|nr:pentapeptide repeat-containing protein [Rhodanobacter sp.]
MADLTLESKEYDDETFKNIELAGALIEDRRFRDCSFVRCNLSDALLARCRFSDCEFIDCNLSLTKVTSSGFSAVTFTDCKMVGINWTDAYWSSIHMVGALSFIRCVLNDSTFFGLHLRELKLIDCRAVDVDFTGANCEDADFSHSDLRDSVFRQTRLARANFSEAKNYSINVFNNDIKRAKFTLPDAMSLLYSLDIELVE